MEHNGLHQNDDLLGKKERERERSEEHDCLRIFVTQQKDTKGSFQEIQFCFEQDLEKKVKECQGHPGINIYLQVCAYVRESSTQQPEES